MSDYMFALESHLNAGQNRAVAEMHRISTEAGMNVWLTGGAMRDMLRGAPIRDLDFTVERDAVQAGGALSAVLGGRITAEDELSRGVEIELPGDVCASVSNARIEKYSSPGGKPHIEPATIHEDLKRRDFTINAIGLALNRGSRGLLVDPLNGQADLENRELRTTNSFVFFNDPSRIFRLIRFEHTLQFTVVPRTQAQLANALLENYQAAASSSSLAREIRAVAMDLNAAPMLEALDRLGLLTLISPSLTASKLNAAGVARFSKLAHSVLAYGTAGGWFAYLDVLSENLNDAEKADLVRAFEMPPEELALAGKIGLQAKKLETALKSPAIHRPSQVWAALESATADEVLMVLYQSPVRLVQDRIRAFYEKYLPQAQEVTGEQVEAATGAKPGTPKFARARRGVIAALLNARPRKVVPAEPEPAPAPLAMAGGRGRK
jgi:tRNA nucleotidyltransferase/poly(A) polymerase